MRPSAFLIKRISVLYVCRANFVSCCFGNRSFYSGIVAKCEIRSNDPDKSTCAQLGSVPAVLAPAAITIESKSSGLSRLPNSIRLYVFNGGAGLVACSWSFRLLSEPRAIRGSSLSKLFANTTCSITNPWKFSKILALSNKVEENHPYAQFIFLLFHLRSAFVDRNLVVDRSRIPQDRKPPARKSRHLFLVHGKHSWTPIFGAETKCVLVG